MDSREREGIEFRLRNILGLHIFGENSIPRDYTTAIRTRDGKNAMIILNLEDEQQATYFRMVKSYCQTIK